MSADSSRPLLLPQNRKLRHLKGIYLRNLTFCPPCGRTIDDSAVSRHLRPLAHLDGPPQIHHSASSENLRPIRRQSTNFSSHSPQTRQQKLQQSIDNRAADVFFSLHTDAEDEPLYLSETIERSTNFNFRFFNLSSEGPAISRSCFLVVKVWAKRQEWSLLLEEVVDLRALSFVGPLQSHHFPPNCLLFHMVDGIYSLDISGRNSTPKPIPPLYTSSYGALMKLSTLENSIQDALATHDALTQKINALLAEGPTPADKLPMAQERVAQAQKFVNVQRRALSTAAAKRNELRASIIARRAAIAAGKEAQRKAETDVAFASSKLPSSYAMLSQTKSQIHGQRRRIAEDLATIFPVTAVPNGAPLSFKICGLSLPNTEYDPSSSSAIEEKLSAALGLVAQLVNALQFYLGVPLPYPLQPFGSRSSIRDNISMLPDSQREYPLYLRGGHSAQTRLDYGWFLLNKDVECLCGALGLRVVDIRHTLPNIKYLLYVASSGQDELPQRKKGGVRGLLMGRMRERLDAGSDGGSTTASRRGSVDSEFLSKQREDIRRALRDGVSGLSGSGPQPQSVDGPGGLNGKTAARLIIDPGSESVGVGIDEGQKLTLKTRGMREWSIR